MFHKTSGQKLVGLSIQTSTSNPRSTTPRTTGGKSRIGTRETPSGCAVRTDKLRALKQLVEHTMALETIFASKAIPGFCGRWVPEPRVCAVHWLRDHKDAVNF